jgi:hypothetical protein
VDPETAPVVNLKRGRNAGFIRQKAAFDTVMPDKSGVPGAMSGRTHRTQNTRQNEDEVLLMARTLRLILRPAPQAIESSVGETSGL